MNRAQPFLKVSYIALALVAFSATGATVVKKTTTVTSLEDPGSDHAVDNSGINEDHRGKITADDQSRNRSDTDITAGIRKALIADDLLSTYAHNVKIITKDGRVTLKGPVRSAAEKLKIGRVASNIAGAKRVSNLLDVSPVKKEGE